MFGHRTWTTLIVSGILAIVFGLLASFLPGTAVLTLVILWGAYALVDGALLLVAGVRAGSAGGGRAFLIITGILGIVAGLVALFRPLPTAVILAWILGVWLILRGVLEIIAALTSATGGRRGLLLLGGLLWAVAGIIFVSRPEAAVVVISLWIGIMAIVWGVLLLVAGLQLRSHGRDSARQG